MKKSTIILIIAILVYFSAHTVIALVINPDNSDGILKSHKIDKAFHNIKIEVDHRAYFDFNIKEKTDTCEVSFFGKIPNINEIIKVDNDTLKVKIDSLNCSELHIFNISAPELSSIKIVSGDNNYFTLSFIKGNKTIDISGNPSITIEKSKLDTVNINAADSLRFSCYDCKFEVININSKNNLNSVNFTNSIFGDIRINK